MALRGGYAALRSHKPGRCFLGPLGRESAGPGETGAAAEALRLVGDGVNIQTVPFFFDVPERLINPGNCAHPHWPTW